jgi:hypothetical protein
MTSEGTAWRQRQGRCHLVHATASLRPRGLWCKNSLWRLLRTIRCCTIKDRQQRAASLVICCTRAPPVYSNLLLLVVCSKSYYQESATPSQVEDSGVCTRRSGQSMTWIALPLRPLLPRTRPPPSHYWERSRAEWAPRENLRQTPRGRDCDFPLQFHDVTASLNAYGVMLILL